MSNRPFSERASKIRHVNGLRYTDMEQRCDRARSSAWWNNLLNYGPWEGQNGTVAPPPPDALRGITALFGCSVEEVATMVAVEWYGIRLPDEVSARVRSLASKLDSLADSDFDLVDNVATRLAVGDKPTRQAA